MTFNDTLREILARSEKPAILWTDVGDYQVALGKREGCPCISIQWEAGHHEPKVDLVCPPDWETDTRADYPFPDRDDAVKRLPDVLRILY